MAPSLQLGQKHLEKAQLPTRIDKPLMRLIDP